MYEQKFVCTFGMKGSTEGTKCVRRLRVKEKDEKKFNEWKMKEINEFWLKEKNE